MMNMNMNDEKETISKEYKECILSAYVLESSNFLIQIKANQHT